MHDTRAGVMLGCPTYTLWVKKPWSVDRSMPVGGNPALQEPTVEAVRNNKGVNGNGHGLRQGKTRPAGFQHGPTYFFLRGSGTNGVRGTLPAGRTIGLSFLGFFASLLPR